MSILIAENVTKSYRLGETVVHALRGVSLAIEEKEFVAIAGSSGSGKTTLLNLFGCIDRPTEGKIRLENTDIGALDDDSLTNLRRGKIGFVFQTFNLLPVLTAMENVEYPLLLSGMVREEREARAMAALTEMGLKSHSGHRPDQFSGGQRQRVAIARAIVKRPRLVIADEPTASLDRKNAGEVLDLMRALNLGSGLTIVISSHDPIALERASRIVHISDGRLEGHA